MNWKQRPGTVILIISGEGGFGSVFKGWVDDNSSTAAKPGCGTLIAVKRFNQEGFQGHEEWLVRFTYIHHLLTFTCTLSCLFGFST